MTINGWDEYKKLVLKELERLDQGVRENADKRLGCAKEVDSRLDAVEQKIAVMATKIWVGAGIVSTIFTAIVAALIKHFGGG